MANINFFVPKSRKGYVMEMNAGIGNLGVPVAQFIEPLANLKEIKISQIVSINKVALG